MKKSIALVCSFLISVLATVLIPATSRAEALPEFRPALIANTKRSLINVIDVQSLMKRGQGNATVMFSCLVSQLGVSFDGFYFRGTPGSEKLGMEVARRCHLAEFFPAVYKHNLVDAWINGTVTFVIIDGKPHLRIYLNQEQDDLLKGRDFVAPQFVISAGLSKFRGFRPPQKASNHEGIAVAAIEVDATGNVVHSRIAYEYPPNMGFGEEIAGRIRDAVFVPGFRGGHPVDSHIEWPVIYRVPGRSHPVKTG